MGLPAPKRRRLHPPPRSSASDAVITFDTTARHDYLTGFHKRKQARIQHAREIAARRAKDERLRERKEVSFLTPPFYHSHGVVELTQHMHNRCGNGEDRI